MSRYGTITGIEPTSTVAQGSDPEELREQLVALASTVPPGHVVTALTLAGAGDGPTFTLTIESAPAANVAGGVQVSDVQFYMASQSEALTTAQANAAAVAGAQNLVDVQVAGGSKGTRFMGMLVYGTLLGTGGGGQCLAPLTQTMYVDGGTSTPTELQNGSISCPFSTIAQALAEIPPPVPFDFADQNRGFVILVTPGVYPEALTIPQGRRVMITSLGLQAAEIPVTVVVDARMFASTVATPALAVENMIISEIDVNADGSDVTPSSFVITVFSSVGAVLDVGSSDAWEGVLLAERSDISTVSVPDAFFTPQHGGLYVVVDCFTFQATDQFFFVLNMNSPTEPPARFIAESVIAIALTAPASHVIQLDADTSFFVEAGDVLAPTHLRRVISDTSKGIKHVLPTSAPLPYGMTERDSAVRVTAAAPGGTVTLPPLSSVAAFSFGGAAQLVQERVVRNHSASTFPVTVLGFAGEPIEAFPGGLPLAPGEAVILIPGEGGADWMVIGDTP